MGVVVHETGKRLSVKMAARDGAQQRIGNALRNLSKQGMRATALTGDSTTHRAEARGRRVNNGGEPAVGMSVPPGSHAQQGPQMVTRSCSGVMYSGLLCSNLRDGARAPGTVSSCFEIPAYCCNLIWCDAGPVQSGISIPQPSQRSCVRGVGVKQGRAAESGCAADMLESWREKYTGTPHCHVV